MKKILIIGLILLGGLNVLLLFVNSDLRSKVNVIVTKEQQWGYEQIGRGNAKIAHPDVSLADAGLSLLVFITDYGCRSCMENEIRNLNTFYKKYEEYTRVYIMSSDKSNMKQFNITFPIKQIDPTGDILDNKFKFANPVALLVDANGMVHDIAIAESGRPEIRNQFYQRLASLFESIE